MSNDNEEYDPKDPDNIKKVARAMRDSLRRPYQDFDLERFKESDFLSIDSDRGKTDAELIQEEIDRVNLLHIEPSIKKQAIEWLETKKQEKKDVKSIQINLDKKPATDLIRIIYALYQKGYFDNNTSLDEVMNQFGRFLGIDLKHHSSLLSQALDPKKSTLESNLKIFDTLKGVIEKRYKENLNKP
jgi:hypothetical protein